MGSHVPDLKLATLISEAAFDPGKWTDVCDQLAKAIGGTGSVIFPSTASEVVPPLVHSEAVSESYNIYVKDQWFLQDLRFRGLQAMRTCGFTTDSDCIEYDEIGRSPYYQEFLSPCRLRWFVAMGFFAKEQECIVSVQASSARDPFTPGEINTLLGYRNLLTNSATVARQLLYAEIQGASDALERHDRAVLAIGPSGSVTHISPSARALIGDAFQVKHGQLRALVERDIQPLQRLVHSLSSSENATHPIPVSRLSGKPALVVYGSPMPERERDIFSPAIALLVIIDPARSPVIPVQLLMDYFAITNAEARLAIALYEGLTLEKHALKNSISLVTTRNHLQNLLRKTETHSKAELVSALAKIIPRK